MGIIVATEKKLDPNPKLGLSVTFYPYGGPIWVLSVFKLMLK